MKKVSLFGFFVALILSCFLNACKHDSYQTKFIDDLNLSEMNNDPLEVKPKSSIFYNVQDYCISQIADEINVEVSFYDDDPQLKSALNSNCRLWMENNLDCIELVKGDEKILLKWDRLITGTINLVIEKNSTREEFIAVPDLDNKTWKYENDIFLQKHQQLVKLLASIASDFDYSFYRESRKNNAAKESNLSNRKESAEAIVPLNVLDPCVATYTSAIYYNFSRSLCCEEAISGVNSECSNEFCIGCCTINGCDWGGIYGDFLGFCTATGKGCSGPV